MAEAPNVVMANERRKGGRALPPSSVAGLAPLLIVAGLLLAVAGGVAVGLFYVSPQFGSAQWEIGTIAQTFDALPLPTLGLVLLALGVRARGGSMFWARAVAVVFAVAAALCLAAMLLFVLDIPVALQAVQRAGEANSQSAVSGASAGLKRAIGKALLFGVCYAASYAWIAVMMWRVPRSQSAHLAGRDAERFS